MKSVLRGISLLVIIVFWLAGCSSGNANETTASLGQEFILPVGQTVVVNNRELVIKFESVTTDSRCPKGVTCVWAGEAKCQMQITYKGSIAKVVFTESGGTDGYSQNIFENYTAYFKLEPYPEAGKQIGSNDYRLLLRIAQLGP